MRPDGHTNVVFCQVFACNRYCLKETRTYEYNCVKSGCWPKYVRFFLPVVQQCEGIWNEIIACPILTFTAWLHDFAPVDSSTGSSPWRMTCEMWPATSFTLLLSDTWTQLLYSTLLSNFLQGCRCLSNLQSKDCHNFCRCYSQIQITLIAVWMFASWLWINQNKQTARLLLKNTNPVTQHRAALIPPNSYKNATF